MVTVRAALLLFGALLVSFAQETAELGLAQRIDAILARPAGQRTHWGIFVVDLDTGETLYEHNADRLFVPASNVKLVSTAIALQRLGADHTFTTTLKAEGRVDESGRLEGDLRLIGGGDPNLSSRLLPYRKKEDYLADRLTPLRQIAERVRDAGIRVVSGNVIGDDSRYVWQPYPTGWSHADTLQAYGSPVSALAFNDNVIELRITPGTAGRAARVALTPQLAFYEISNRTKTTNGRYVERRLLARWGEARDEVVLAGHIPAQSKGRTIQLAADDPALYAAIALRQALADIGIDVEGRAESHHRLPDQLASLRSAPAPQRAKQGKALAEITSVSISEAIRVVNKDSQNLHAEMLLREVALQESGIGSQEASIDSLRRFLAAVGLSSGEFFLRDGSGLSRHNLLAPAATVRLLEFMWRSDDRDAFVASLPVAGHDGTLDWRFKRSAAYGRLRAKTGSMSHVLALSGYVSSDPGRTLAFSIFANNFGIVVTSTRHLMDAIAAELVKPDRD